VVDVVVRFVILLSIIPVTLAQRLTRDTGISRPAARRVPRPGAVAAEAAAVP
jgi:hypothetical protein